MLFQYSQYFQNILIIINKIGGSTFSRLNSQDKSVTIGDPFLPFYPPRDHAGSQGRFSSRQFSPSTFYASSIIVLEETRRMYIYIYTHTPIQVKQRKSRCHGGYAFLSPARFTDLRSLPLDTELIKFRSFFEPKKEEQLLNEAVRGTKHILMSYFASHHHPDNVRARCANTRMNLGNAPPPPLENQFLWRRSTRACRLERWRRPIPPRWWRRGGGDWRRCPLEVISTGINSPSWHRLIPCNWNIFAFRGGRRDCN